MLAKPVHRDEQIKLIMECRQSGLTDFEWCRQHNINVGTFYNWVKRLKRTEGITFPRGDKADGTFAYKQEVVKLDMLQAPAPVPGTNDQYNNSVVLSNYIEATSLQTEMVPIGTEVIRTEIRFTEPKLTRIEYVATTYECPECKLTEDPQFIKDNGTPALIEHSYVSESLAAWVLNQKFVMAAPFYRQEKFFSDLGVDISRTTMASWTIECYKRYFKPLTEYFHRRILQRRFIMMDETPIQVLKEEDRRPQTKSYVWAQRTGEDGLPPIIYFHYTPSRAGENAVELLEVASENTYLMVDGYSGYNKVNNIKHCCCYAHIRRKFYEAIPKGQERNISLPAVQAVSYCDKLFSYEREYKEKGLSYKQRYNRRLKHAKPVIEAFLSWLDTQHAGDNAKFNTALTYVNNRRNQLMTYLEDGRCSLSNNLTENTIRPITCGRKNWLFSDTPEGAHASMSVYTLIENAKAHNLKTYA